MSDRRICALLAMACAMCACGYTPSPAPVVARMTPPQMQLCVESILERYSVRTELAPMPRATWRLRLSVLAGPPAGWLSKGDLIYDGARLSYLPDGATAGLMDTQIRNALGPVAERCR